MKKQFLNLLALAALLSLPACKKQAPEGKPASAESTSPASAPEAAPAVAASLLFPGARQTSFHEVTSQLDPGGSLFFYLAADQWLAGLSTNIARFQEVLFALPSPAQGNRDEIERAFGLITRLVQASGVEAITGVGASSAPVAPGLYRSKFIVHHPGGAGQGFVWSMFGRAPHAMAGQSMLPTNTAFAAFGDLDVAQLWQVLERELTQSDIPGAAEALRSWPEQFEKSTKLPWNKLIESLGGEAGLLLTLDNAHTVELPMGTGGRMALPAPGLFMAVKVKNSLLYDRISTELKSNPKSVTTEEAGLKICAMPVPVPLPMAVELAVASSDDYFYVASSSALVRSVHAVRQGQQPGLKSSAEFQELARHLPAQGNQFIYVARKFGETIADIQQQVIEESPMPPEQRDLIRRLFGDGNASYGLTIGGHSPTGWQTTAVGNRDSASTVLLAPTIGVTAFGAGLLLPALAKAKARAQAINSVNQLKQLGLAARMYANDHQDKFPKAETWSDDIRDFVGSAKVFKAGNDPSPSPCSYAYNEKLSGMDVSKIDPRTVLFFETENGKWNGSGGSELMLRSPRAGGPYVIGLADGSVQQMPASRISSLRWDP